MPLLKYGAGGMQAAQQARMNDLAMAQTRQQMQVTNMKMEHAQIENDLQQEASRYMQNLMRGEPASPGSDVAQEQATDYADAFRKTAHHMFQMGGLSVGQDFLAEADKLDKSRAEAVRASYDNTKAAAEAHARQADAISALVDHADTQEKYLLGLANLVRDGVLPMDAAAALSRVPNTPEHRQFIRAQAMSVKDRLAQELNEAKEARAAADSAERIGLERRRTIIAEARFQEDRRSKMRDRAGETAATPKKDQLDNAKAVIDQMVFGGSLPSAVKKWTAGTGDLTPEVADYIALQYRIADDANYRVSKIPGLSYGEAVSRSVQAGLADGSITPGKKTFTFEPMGRTPQQAEPIVKAPQWSDMVEGRWYSYNGWAFRRVKGASDGQIERVRIDN